jgi:hypothetical protein
MLNVGKASSGREKKGAILAALHELAEERRYREG